MDLLNNSAAANKTSSDNVSNTSLAQESNYQIMNITRKQIIENIFLAENKFYKLPSGFIEYISRLVDLDLSNSCLRDLPKSFNMLKTLVSLNLNSNQFLTIPHVICELYNLKRLWASNNKIKYLPYNLGSLSKLEILSLNINQLRDIPNSYAKLDQLKVCCLSNNKFNKIPNCVTRGMRNLQTFEFSKNNHVNLDIYPRSTNLTIFYAEENICPSFPRWILTSHYNNLETVSLNKTRFKTFCQPRRMSICYIKRLFMGECCLNTTIVESIIAGMINLEELILGGKSLDYHNYFPVMPINAKERPYSLKKLDLQNTRLPIVSTTIERFINLRHINLSSNNIFFLPEEICNLKYLITLIMDSNYLRNLPKNTGKLVSLKELKLRHNRMNKLPLSMKSLLNLEYIDLYDNEFSVLPEVLLACPKLKGLDLEQNYFSTQYLMNFRCSRYKDMRVALRNYWTDPILGNMSFSQNKLNIFVDNTRILSSSSSSDSSDVHSEYLGSSEDSSDNFDPHECRSPKKQNYSHSILYQPYQEVYCPADFHETAIQTRITEMLQSGALVWPSSYEEGQFEDA